MASEKFCLRWNDFESNISTAFRELRDDKDFFDVTLACDDEQIQAHKVILSACSPFFRTVLRRNPHAHPLLYLKGVKFSDLQSVLNFMYHGEVNVAQEELNSFLAVAEELRVKGLTQNQSGGKKDSSYSSPAPKPPPAPSRLAEPTSLPPPKRPRPPPAPSNHHALQPSTEDDDIQEVMPVKSEPREAPLHAPAQAQELYSHALQAAEGEEQYGEEQYEDYGQYEGEGGFEGQEGGDGNKGDWESLMAETEGGTMCLVCHKVLAYKHDAKRHIKLKHGPSGQPVSCELCAKELKHHWALGDHMRKVHGQYAKKAFA